MTEPAPELAELAAAHGVETHYDDWQGRLVAVPAGTVVAVLGALGVDASGPEATRRALTEHRLARWRRLLPAAVVTRSGWASRFPVHVTHGDPRRGVGGPRGREPA